MTAKKIAVSLDATSLDALERLSGSGSRSEYLRRAIGWRMRTVRQAHAALLAYEWSRAEVLAACDALNGCWLSGHQSRSTVAMELHDWARLDGDAPSRWGVDPNRWAAIVEEVRGDDYLARAIVDLVTEWWATEDGSEAHRLVDLLGAADE